MDHLDAPTYERRPAAVRVLHDRRPGDDPEPAKRACRLRDRGRELASFAHARSLEPDGEGAAAWLSEFVWREFFAQVLWHRPDVVACAFRREYASLRFENDPAKFAAWCEGRTGYPIVDAGMRQLNATGYMHNRLRMIAAS